MANLHRLLRAEMYARKALGTVVADGGKRLDAVGNRMQTDVVLRADFGTNTAADTLARIDELPHGSDADRLQRTTVH